MTTSLGVYFGTDQGSSTENVDDQLVYLKIIPTGLSNSKCMRIECESISAFFDVIYA